MTQHKSIDWVFAYDGTAGELAYALKCRRCGQVQKVPLPASVDYGPSGTGI